MKELEMTLPSKYEVFGSKLFHIGQLDYFKRHGSSAESTFLAKLIYSDDFNSYWTRSRYDKIPSFFAKVQNNNLVPEFPSNDNVYIRPVIKIPKEMVKEVIDSGYFGRGYFFYGEYPQSSVDEEIIAKLNYDLKKETLTETGRTFSFYIRKEGINFGMTTCKEYELGGQRYIPLCCETSVFSSSKRTKWIKVEPVAWAWDPKKRLLISEKNLLIGVPISRDKYRGNFRKTNMRYFLNINMLPDMLRHVEGREDVVENVDKEIPTITDSVVSDLEKKLVDDGMSSEEFDALRDAFQQVKKEMNGDSGTKKRR